MNMTLTLLFLLFLQIRGAACLFIEGCPVHGCRPSGSFSMYLNITRINASIAWTSNFNLVPIPKPLGCVANDVSTICQSNGQFDVDTGYVSLNAKTGNIQWRDKLLKFPTLPVLDNFGDVTGSDGTRLVHYDADGKTYPIIPCEGLTPLISLQIVGTVFLLLVSESGLIVARATNGVPVGDIKLDYVIDGLNGTFIPVSRPVVNGNRFYLLTRFTSSVDAVLEPNLQRLFAIDIHQTLDKRITIAWFYDFPRTYGKSKMTNFQNAHQTYLYENQVLLWDNAENLIYASLQPNADIFEADIESPAGCLFWAIRDFGNHSSLTYCNKWAVQHMTKFEANTDVKERSLVSSNVELLWVFTKDSYLHAVSGNGTVVKSFNLQAIFGTAINITSNAVLAKADENSPGALIFAIETQQLSTNAVFRSSTLATSGHSVVAVRADVDSRSSDVILWLVPVPGNMRVRGQISGSSGAETQTTDKLIVYAESGNFAQIFAIN